MFSIFNFKNAKDLILLFLVCIFFTLPDFVNAFPDQPCDPDVQNPNQCSPTADWVDSCRPFQGGQAIFKTIENCVPNPPNRPPDQPPGRCVPSDVMVKNCGISGWADPPEYRCDPNNPAGVQEKFMDRSCVKYECVAEVDGQCPLNSFRPAIGTPEDKACPILSDKPCIKPTVCRNVGSWVNVKTCVDNELPDLRCTPTNIEQKYTSPICDLRTESQCRERWVPIQSCADGTCVPVGGDAAKRCNGSTIEVARLCKKCIVTSTTNSDGIVYTGQCKEETMWDKAAECGPAQKIVTESCRGSVKCTTTIDYPGTCITQLTGPVCAPPRITEVCNGPCDGYHHDCNGAVCKIVPGPGNIQCTTDANCGTGKFNICSGGRCIISNGTAPNQCLLNEDCTLRHKECNSQKQCVDMTGPGRNQCVANGDCSGTGGGKHNECSAGRCVVEDGVGSDFCQTDSDCQYHSFNRCTVLGQCMSQQGVSANQCLSPADCVGGRHNECNSQKQCVVVPGTDFNQCNTDIDCSDSTTHLACVQNRYCRRAPGLSIDLCAEDSNCAEPSHAECSSGWCLLKSGAGSNFCQTNSDCSLFTHTECVIRSGSCGSGEVCSSGVCASVWGKALNQCGSDSDCANGGRHNVCSGDRCVVQDGPGPSSCWNDEDCASSFKQCQNQTCATIKGKGSDTCGSNADCIGDKHTECVKHTECQGGKCVFVSGKGEGKCLDDIDCTRSFRDCVNDTCTLVNGEGIDNCFENGYCGPGPKHTECQNDSCVMVKGGGPALCGSDADCSKTFTKCQGNSCVSVHGIGFDECYLTCGPFHTECKDGVCTYVEGAGDNTCDSTADCANSFLTCVDGDCVRVQGNGVDSCPGYCGPHHTECEGGPGGDGVCVNKRGEGTSTCSNNVDCSHSYSICVNNACITVAGSGISNCYYPGYCE